MREEPPHSATESVEDAAPIRGIGAGIRRLLSVTAFVFLSSMIVVMASERVYWYWAANPDEFLFNAAEWWGLGVWYCLPTLAGLWALGWAQATRWYQVVLGAAVYAFITEGVITPVMYEGGLFDPFMPAMFLGWHGMLAMVGFLFLTRALIVRQQRRTLALVSVAAGLIWGVRATTSWLPESAPEPEAVQEDGWSTTILGPIKFAGYALVVGGVFAVCHWLIARVWPAEFRPGKWSTICVILINTLLFIPMAIAIPWAPLKFGFFTGIALWALGRSRRGNEGPTIFTRFGGPARWIDVAPLLLMPLAALTVYAGVGSLDPPEETIRTYCYFGLVWVQVVVGGTGFVWAIAKSFNCPKPTGTRLSTADDHDSSALQLNDR